MTRIPMAAPTAHPTAKRLSLRTALLSAPLLAVLLSGCDTVSGWFGKTPDPPLPGERVSVLTRERKVEVDQRLVGTPVAPSAGRSEVRRSAFSGVDPAASKVTT